jgi:signal transduction histidine kinase
MEKILDKDQISFHAEGRLLQELGLRLVASPEVALVELIKNAYDADSPSCTVRLEDDERTLIVADEGHGMTLADFKMKWMRIATSSKIAQEVSEKFHRKLTGSKGIGRFAVRYLGDHLTLESVAHDSHYKCVTRLKADFDWPRLDKAQDISNIRVDYKLVEVPAGTPTGTVLTIKKLRTTTDFTRSTELRDNVLRIVSPLQGLERGRFANDANAAKEDPGFKVVLPGEGGAEDVDLAKLVLDSYWGRLTIELDGNRLRFRVWLHSLKKTKTLEIRVPNSISSGLFADIRYFPRRAGIFQGRGVHGQKAWRWVRDNCGVKIVDHGFHIRPYGFADDDWLLLARDKAHSKREWMTAIANNHFPLTRIEKADPAANPVLYLPYNYQLVGAVFIESRRDLGGEDKTDLVPSMDREGLLENAAFQQFREFIRAGIEFLAHEDKAELDRQATRKAREAARTASEEIRQAIEFIERSPTLTPADKAGLIAHYRSLSDRIKEQEEYSAQARQSLLSMSLLGVVAGFMTHESKAILHELEQATEQVHALAKKNPELSESAGELTRRLEVLRGHLEYVQLFVQKVRTTKEEPLSASGQVRHVLKRFKPFADEKGIDVRNEVASDVMTPPLPVTLYSGVLLNLYTNALKAILAAQRSIKAPQVVIRAWNESGKHILEVADNGVGIPPEIRKRIWEPLYTTTSDIGNPLGSGMGLGLTLIKQLVTDFGGSIALVPEPPPGFTTCFRVMFSNE